LLLKKKGGGAKGKMGEGLRPREEKRKGSSLAGKGKKREEREIPDPADGQITQGMGEKKSARGAAGKKKEDQGKRRDAPGMRKKKGDSFVEHCWRRGSGRL